MINLQYSLTGTPSISINKVMLLITYPQLPIISYSKNNENFAGKFTHFGVDIPYNISTITAPGMLFYGKTDYLANEQVGIVY